jgi:hypothetical protein
MSKTEKQIEQLRHIVTQHVFKSEDFWRFNVGLVDGVLQIQVAPDRVERVREGIEEFFSKHTAHPLKTVPRDVVGNAAYREPVLRPRVSSAGKRLLGDLLF